MKIQQATGHTAYHHVGADAADPTTSPTGITLMDALRYAGVGLAAYHGYRRNQSIGWAIGWAFLAGISPPIVVGVAVAQGFGKRKAG